MNERIEYDETTAPTGEDEMKFKPESIMFFPNGTAAVCCGGQQIPKYQVGYHMDTIDALKADGIDWRTIPEILGYPQNRRKDKSN